MEKIKEAQNLVDEILDGSYITYKVLGRADRILDEIENSIDNVPDQDMESLLNDVESDIAKDDKEEQEEEDEELAAQYENRNLKDMVKESVELIISENAYREYFKAMLKKRNISSPTQLSDEKKKEFFAQVARGWKGKKE